MRILRRFWFWLRRRQLEAGLEEEMRQHLEAKAQENISQGMFIADAWRSAYLDFGNAALAREHSRRNWGFPSFIFRPTMFLTAQAQNPGRRMTRPGRSACMAQANLPASRRWLQPARPT